MITPIHQGASIEGCYSPCDQIIAVYPNSTSNLNIIIGKQTDIVPQIANHFDEKMGDGF